jgi:hypothetical protein
MLGVEITSSLITPLGVASLRRSLPASGHNCISTFPFILPKLKEGCSLVFYFYIPYVYCGKYETRFVPFNNNSQTGKI